MVSKIYENIGHTIIERTFYGLNFKLNWRSKVGLKPCGMQHGNSNILNVGVRLVLQHDACNEFERIKKGRASGQQPTTHAHEMLQDSLLTVAG